VATAQRDVAIVAADFDLGTVADGLAGGIDAEIHRGFAAAMADGF
jgi:hypothetical protein